MCGVSTHGQNIAKLKQEIRLLLKTAVPEAFQAFPTTAWGWNYTRTMLESPSRTGGAHTDSLQQLRHIIEIAKLKFQDSFGQTRDVYTPFVLACCGEELRRSQITAETQAPEAHMRAGLALRWLQDQPPQPVLQLWVARCLSGSDAQWDLGMAERIDDLWEQALRRQVTQGVGHLHPLSAETCLDAFVFDELAALHAGFIVAVTSPAEQHKVRLEQMHTLARYHVENTQPDNTTNQPWGLPAFAYWPDTFPFALQQWHDTRTWLATHPGPMSGLIAGLLADAVVYLSNHEGV